MNEDFEGVHIIVNTCSFMYVVIRYNLDHKYANVQCGHVDSVGTAVYYGTALLCR